MGLLQGLTGGRFRLTDSAINVGDRPFPTVHPGAPFTADALINQASSLLPGGLNSPYAYGQSARISTQTQMAHPNRIAAVIPVLKLPAPESDGHDMLTDPELSHSISDGDLVFTLNLGAGISTYCQAPYGHAAKAVPLINLATVNYLLWGLQVGLRRDKNSRWSRFFSHITQGDLEKHLRLTQNAPLSEAVVWGFLRTYVRPLGIQHGGDQQGGLHEGGSNRLATHNAMNYVSSFALEGRLEHVNNLWRDYDVHEHDDLALVMRHKAAGTGDIHFDLSSSVLSHRQERVPVSSGFFYLRPETLAHRSFSDACYIHVGRAFQYCGQYTRVQEAACWNARVPVIPGAPIKLTLDLLFVDSEDMYYAELAADHGDEDHEAQDDARRKRAALVAAEKEAVGKRARHDEASRAPGDAAASAPPDGAGDSMPHALSTGGKTAGSKLSAALSSGGKGAAAKKSSAAGTS